MRNETRTHEGAVTIAPSAAPLFIATIARERGITGVHTHVRQLRRYLDRTAGPAELVTPHSWARGARNPRALLLGPLFGARLVLERTYGPANVWWYRRSHELFLRRALRRRLAGAGPCTVYAQCPVSAKAALDVRSGPHQRVVLAVHFRVSQADEWADKGQIPRDGRVYRQIRDTERNVLTRVDGLVFVSEWGRTAVRAWMPEVDRVPTRVLHNFVTVPPLDGPSAKVGDLVSVGNLEAVKNHRFLLQVLAAAGRRGHRYTLDVFGEGVERARLLALADELGLADRVRLHGFCSDVQQRLPGYRACVHASYSESLPLAVIEAMAAGLPVVSSTAGGLGELFHDPEQGRFWPIDDAEDAARILVDLMEDPAELARCGRAAREKCRRDHDADVVAPMLLDFLRSSLPPNRLS
jgi:glycosyltransferase involved in cell wall biosynthesis